ncbi:MAG: hypothetical protein C0403_01895 [Desulfobacterium sp.]|nr:hypothetical protein [Desulfobacterium sp.]
MKKKNSIKTKHPISKKILASFNHYLDRKVIDISEIKNGKIRAEELDKSIVSGEKLSGYDPLHAIYIYAQNKMSVFVELLAQIPEMAKIVNPYIDSQDEYMPSGPPMSPLTASYFFCWGCFDSWAGISRETFGTVAINLCTMLDVDTHLIKVFQAMQDSRMGFYVHEGFSGNKVFLREIVTQKKHIVIVPSGYLGEDGQVWFVRILPEPFPELGFGHSVVFTTPYVILENDNSSVAFSNENSWILYFERNLKKTGKKDKSTAYEFLMKYGLNKNYWNEYIFQGYINHLNEVIYLTGYPDIPLSMPHSKESQRLYGF